MGTAIFVARDARRNSAWTQFEEWGYFCERGRLAAASSRRWLRLPTHSVGDAHARSGTTGLSGRIDALLYEIETQSRTAACCTVDVDFAAPRAV